LLSLSRSFIHLLPLLSSLVLASKKDGEKNEKLFFKVEGRFFYYDSLREELLWRIFKKILFSSSAIHPLSFLVVHNYFTP
jgi:hypothetical protein